METMVYLASDIQKALGLGRSKTYLFLDEVYRQQENPPFRVIKVGKLFRVPKNRLMTGSTQCNKESGGINGGKEQISGFLRSWELVP